jgi:hypothetical protein
MTTAASLVLETARRGELHHAVILHGPSPAELRDLAMRVAKTLNCVNGTTGDLCSACARIGRDSHPDVHVIGVGENKKMISIEQVRAAVEEATLRPYEGRNKVFVFLIDPADSLSIGASHSLLKTLEEPADDTTFILVTRSPELLLPTIRSRAQPIYVGSVSAAGRAAMQPLQQARLEQVAMFESAEERDGLAAAILDGLHRYATRGEGAALLGIASRIAGAEHVKDALALFGSLLCDAAALHPHDTSEPDRFVAVAAGIPREALLAAADAALNATKWFTVNADVRLLAEMAVAPLAKR